MLPLHHIAAYLQARPTRRDDEGATAVAYGLLVSLIALVIIGGATIFGDKIGALVDGVAGKIKIPVATP